MTATLAEFLRFVKRMSKALTYRAIIIKERNIMAELVTMALFCAALIACIITNISIVPALLAGVVMFLIHGKITGHKFATMLSKGFATMRAASIVAVTFVLIGLLTTLWRAAGTVPFIVANTSSLVRPHVVILLAFLLNCLMSLLTGSSFATAATMGVITMTLGTSMQVSPVFLGGAILSGVYFGDRCSPVSTSAQLVKTLTHTNIFDNIVLMLKTSIVPFIITCAIYAVWALCTHPSAGSIDITGLFSSAFDLHWVTVIPALVLVVLAIARMDVRITMGASILTGGKTLITGNVMTFDLYQTEPVSASASKIHVRVFACVASDDSLEAVSPVEELDLASESEDAVARITPIRLPLASTVKDGQHLTVKVQRRVGETSVYADLASQDYTARRSFDRDF